MSSLKVVGLLQTNTTRIEQKLPERCLQFCIPKSSNKYWAFLATFHCPCSPLEMKCRRRYFFSADGRISDSSLAVGVWFWWWTCRTLSTLQSLCTATYWCFDTQGRDAQDVKNHCITWSIQSGVIWGGDWLQMIIEHVTVTFFEQWVDLPEKHSYLILLLTPFSMIPFCAETCLWSMNPWPMTWFSADTSWDLNSGSKRPHWWRTLLRPREATGESGR